MADDDAALLRRYAQARDEAAFATLARRHLPLVYSAATRRVGHRHLAEDITQAVFMILSKKASSIPASQPLSAWLLTTTRYCASNAMKLDARRRRHESAAAIDPLTGTCSPDPSAALIWQELSTHLDDAVLKLPALDRRVVLLRYFEDRPLQEIALALNTTEGAIKQRLSRAIDKLRTRLNRQTAGLLAATDAAALTSLLTRHALSPIPPGLTLTSHLTTTTTTLSIAKGAMNMMTLTKAKLAACLVAALTLTGATGVVTLNHALAADPAPIAKPHPAPNAPPAPKDKKADNYLGIVTVADAPPVVVETSPKSGTPDVDPATTELKVTFSKDMQDGSWSWAQISDATFPKTTAKPHYADDHRTCILPVKLEPNHTYVIQLNYPPFTGFADPEHRKATPYLLVFQTRD